MPKGVKGFQPGQSGNPKGMKPGTKNKTTVEMKETLNMIIAGQIDNIESALNELLADDKKAYLDLLQKYMTYVLPKKTDITSDNKSININWSEGKTYVPDEN